MVKNVMEKKTVNNGQTLSKTFKTGKIGHKLSKMDKKGQKHIPTLLNS